MLSSSTRPPTSPNIPFALSLSPCLTCVRPRGLSPPCVCVCSASTIPLLRLLSGAVHGSPVRRHVLDVSNENEGRKIKKKKAELSAPSPAVTGFEEGSQNIPARPRTGCAPARGAIKAPEKCERRLLRRSSVFESVNGTTSRTNILIIGECQPSSGLLCCVRQPRAFV